MEKKHFMIIAFVIAMIVPIFFSNIENKQPVPCLQDLVNVGTSLPSNRTSQIVLTSDADWGLYATSGSGTIGDPWILENYLIECNGSLGGFIVQNCDDYAIIRNSHVNESHASYAGVAFQSSSHVTVQNVTVESSAGAAFATVASNNIAFEYCTVYVALFGLYTDGSYDISFSNMNVTTIMISSTPVYEGKTGTSNGSTRITIEDSYLDGCGSEKFTLAYDSIDCTFDNCTFTNGTGIGLYTVDGMEFTDCVIGNGSTPTGIFLNNADDITVDGCTFNVTTYAIDGSTSTYQDDNLTITDCTTTADLACLKHSDHVSITGCESNGLLLYYCSDVTIFDNTITDCGTNAILFNGDTSPREIGLNITGNTFVNCSDEMIKIVNVNNVVIDSNTIRDTSDIFIYTSNVDNVSITNNDMRYCHELDMITLEVSTSNVLIDSNYFYSPANGTSDCDAGVWIATSAGGNFTISNNTFDSINDTTNGNAIIIYGSNTGINIMNNTFINNKNAIYSTSTMNVTGNYFYSKITSWFAGTATGFIWERNYYRDYFDYFPEAITTNSSVIELEFDYAVTATLNDTYPYYYEDWFTRPETINVRFYSNVNYEGILLDHLRVYVDGMQIASNVFTPGHVLFSLVVYDYEGKLLYDEVFNMNATGLHLNIPLATTAQVFFQFWSSIDGFGMVFNTVKFYIDGVRITTDAPIMRPRIIKVVVKDGFDTIIYNQTLDLYIIGVYVDIFLPLAPFTVTNNFNRSVVVNLMRGSTSTKFTIGPRSSIPFLRYAVGIYTYIIEELNGTDLIIDTHEIEALEPATWLLEFGWVTQDVEPIGSYVPTPLDYMLAFVALGLGIGIPALIVAVMRIKGRPPKRQSGKTRYTRMVVRS